MRDAPSEPRRGVPPFTVIYEQYFDLVWSAARHFGVPKDAIDDVVQEVFVVIHARLETVQHAESLRSWVYGVARRTISSLRRAQRTRSTTQAQYEEMVDWLACLPETPLDVSERNEQQLLLIRILSELDEMKREVLVLAELEEFTAPEIAAVLDIPVNTVYSRLRVARQAFEQALTRHLARQKRID
jgi:RNA polymerase sigma-70 factor (ECF subfamily)